MKALKLSDDVSFPAEFVTSKAAILSMQGRGKTHIAKVLAEEMMRLGQQIIVADPTGVWWGLTSNESGKGAGYHVLVLGGDHGEVPLSPTAGQEIADVVIAQRVSVVLDMSGFDSDAQKVRFMTAFCDRLYRKNRRPVHLFLDEADEFIPQNPNADETRMLHVVKRIWQRGRVKGIGGTIISQRSAVVHKTVLSQSSTLIALQTVGPQDRKALQAWFDAWGTEEQAEEFKSTIAGLPKHQAWIWSPEFDIFERTKARPLSSFDSSSTPDVRHGKMREPASRYKMGLDKLKAVMTAAVEEAEANDVDKLREKAKHFETQFRHAKARVELLERRLKDKTVDYGPIADVARSLRSHVTEADKATATISTAYARLESCIHAVKESSALLAARIKEPARVVPVDEPARPAAPARVRAAGSYVNEPATSEPSTVSGGERRMMTVLAQYGRTDRGRLRALAGITSTDTLRTYLGRMKTKQQVVEPSKNEYELTPKGHADLGTFDPLPTGDALVEHWKREIGGGGTGQIFAAMIERPSVAWIPERLMETAGIQSKDTFRTYVGRLITMRVIEKQRDGSIALDSGLKQAIA